MNIDCIVRQECRLSHEGPELRRPDYRVGRYKQVIDAAGKVKCAAKFTVFATNTPVDAEAVVKQNLRSEGHVMPGRSLVDGRTVQANLNRYWMMNSGYSTVFGLDANSTVRR